MPQQHLICGPNSRACHRITYLSLPRDPRQARNEGGSRRQCSGQEGNAMSVRPSASVSSYRVRVRSDRRTRGRTVVLSDEQTPHLCAHFSITAFLTPAAARPSSSSHSCARYGEKKTPCDPAAAKEEEEEDDETKLYNLGPNFDKWTETDVTRRRSRPAGGRAAEHTDLERIVT